MASNMSADNAQVKRDIPKNACNSHLHIIDPSFPNDGKARDQEGTVETYKSLAEKFGLSRAVFVQAKVFGTDNSCLTDAIEKYGTDNSRGIAVVTDKVSDAELESLNKRGVRGLRFSVWNPSNAVVSFDMCAPLAERIKDMGWNVQLHMSAAQFVEHADVIKSLKCKIVIDHMGRLDPKLGTKDPAFPFICKLIDAGHTWVKLSGPYLNTALGEPWADALETAAAFAGYAPERMLWGSDFPHTTEKIKPSPEAIFETLFEWLPDEKNRHLALVENPAEVYGF